jgi:hypothetical protein
MEWYGTVWNGMTSWESWETHRISPPKGHFVKTFCKEKGGSHHFCSTRPFCKEKEVHITSFLQKPFCKEKQGSHHISAPKSHSVKKRGFTSRLSSKSHFVKKRGSHHISPPVGKVGKHWESWVK